MKEKDCMALQDTTTMSGVMPCGLSTSSLTVAANEPQIRHPKIEIIEKN